MAPSLRDRLTGFANPPKTKTVEELQGFIPVEVPGRRLAGRKTASVTRFTKRTPYRTLLNLYRNDSVIFGAVNKVARALTAGKFVIEGGTEGNRKAVQDWIDRPDTNFIPVLRESILLDILLSGTGFGEYALNDSMDDIKYLAPISPEDIHYKTDTYGRVRIDKEGNPLDFEYDSVTGNKIPLTSEKVLTLRLFGPESDFLGQSPLETAFRPSLLKLNIEDALGQSALRHGFPVYVMSVGDADHDITAEQAKALNVSLKNLSERVEWVIPYWWKLEVKEGQIIPEMIGYVDYFTNVQLAPFGYPKALLLQTQLGRVGGAMQTIITAFEEDTAILQENLCRQISQKFFKQLLITQGKLNRNTYDAKEIPTCRFEPTVSSQKLNRARRVSILARVGLITHDTNLEKFLRKEEGLPERDPNAPIPPPPGQFPGGFPPRKGTKPAGPGQKRTEPEDDGGEQLVTGQRRT